MSPIISGGSGGLGAVTVSGAAASGKVPVASSASAAAWAFPPGFEVGYDQVTAGVTVASTTEATGTTLITCAAHTFDGAAVVAFFYCPAFNFGTNTSNVTAVSLFEGVTQIGRLGQVQSISAGTGLGVLFVGFLRFTPTAASHTYTVTAFSNSVAGTAPVFNAGAAGTGALPPMFVVFNKA